MLRDTVIKTCFTLSLLTIGICRLDANIIPPERLVDWTPGVSVGVPGGIPTNRTSVINVTANPFLADKTGNADATPAIQAAIDSATAGQVVYIPSGTYRINSSIYVRPSKSNITIRGAGNTTILDARGGTVFEVGSSSDYAWAQQGYAYPQAGNTVTAGLTKGSTDLTMSDTTPFSAGQLIQVALENQTDTAAIRNGAVPVVSVGGFGETRARRQMSRIVSKTATTLKIFPALHFTPEANLNAKVNVAQQQINGFGLEDLHIELVNATAGFGVFFQQAFGSWVKDVTISKPKNYGIAFDNSLNCEIRKCDIRLRNGGGSNGAGILMNHTGNSLIEDNIIYRIFPAVEINSSSTGNVIAYNFFYNTIGGTLNVNHGAHNSFNLFEGNITPNIQSDGYFGSSSEDTFFRNWITGTLFEDGGYAFIVGLNRFTRKYSLVGNILGSAGWPYGSSPYSFGNPNMGNSSFTGTAQPSAGAFWSDWNMTATLTTRTSDTAGVITVSSVGRMTTWNYVGIRWGKNNLTHFYPATIASNTISFVSANGTPLPPQGSTVSVFTGSAGYQESDLDVQATTLLKANYHAWTSGGMAIPVNQSIGADTLPNSLYHSTKPSWFGDRNWPAFDPFNPNPAYDSIPAGYRYLNGSSPPSGIASAPANVRILRQ